MPTPGVAFIPAAKDCSILLTSPHGRRALSPILPPKTRPTRHAGPRVAWHIRCSRTNVIARVSPQRSPAPERDRVSPWNLGGLGVVELAKRVWSEAGEDEIFDRAAALSYYFVF